MGMEKPKQPTPEEMSEIQKTRALETAEMIEKGAGMTPEGSLIPTEEIKREKRVEYYLEKTKKEIEEMRKAGREKEAKTMEYRLGLAEDRWWDKDHHIYDVLLSGEREEVVYDNIEGAKKEMDSEMRKREGKREWEDELSIRVEKQEELEKLSWEAIDFKENVNTIFKEKGIDIDEEVQIVKEFLVSSRGPGKSEGDTINECHDTEFGKTANSRPEITEEHKRGLEILLGRELPKDRIEAVHYTYTPDAELSAVVLTLSPEKDMWEEIRKVQEQFLEDEDEKTGGRKIIDGVAYYKAEEDVREKYKNDIEEEPFLGNGSLVIKKDGTQYFISNVTWKQYPSAAPSGRVVMTFAGGASRGIFDERACYSTRDWSTSTGSKSFNIDDPDTYKWDYYLENGGKDLPPARMEYDAKNNVIIVGVDAYDERKQRIVSNIE